MPQQERARILPTKQDKLGDESGAGSGLSKLLKEHPPTPTDLDGRELPGMPHSLSRLLHRDSSGILKIDRNESVPNQALLAGAALKPEEGHVEAGMRDKPKGYNLSARRKSEIHDALAPGENLATARKDGDLIVPKPRIQMPPMALGAGGSGMGSKLNLVDAGMLAASVDATR